MEGSCGKCVKNKTHHPTEVTQKWPKVMLRYFKDRWEEELNKEEN